MARTFGYLRLVDDQRDRSKQRCEVMVDGEPVCELAVSAARWEFDAQARSVLTVTTLVESAAVQGLDHGRRR